MVHTHKRTIHEHLKPFILVGNYQEVVIVEDDVARPNLQVNTMPIKEQETLRDEDVIDDKLNKESHEVLGDALQIFVDAKVCDDSNIISCEHWSMHIRHGIHV
jgi:hypothetical protein